jgi:hypothetical protein
MDLGLVAQALLPVIFLGFPEFWSAGACLRISDTLGRLRHEARSEGANGLRLRSPYLYMH